jgi:signal transduction histidine kinase/ActR/RegA family two-component response regulator
MLARKNTISLRLAIGAILLVVSVGLVFAAAISAASKARDADHAAGKAREFTRAASNARFAVATASETDTAALRRAARATTVAATAADASPHLEPTTSADIRGAANAFRTDPVNARRSLVDTLTSALDEQEAVSAKRSSDLDSSLTRAVLFAVAGLVLAVLTLAFLGTELLRSVTAPMRRVAAGAKRLSAGDLSTRVPERGVANLKDLARAFNSMAVSIQATRKTLDQQRSQLAASRAETERATRAKDEFLSRMSHELRTPLNAILGFAQLLELDELDSRQRDNVAHIVSGGRHLLDLINEVLEISRIESGSISPVIEPVHATSIVREAIELVGPLAAQRGIELDAPVESAESVWLSADHQRLKQVLLNLLANAVKYNRDGGSVSVRIKQVGVRGRILVTDTGQGIPQDQLPRLFVPFERLGAESTGVEGTGLGLVLALRLAEAMDGTLGVESQPWIGSTFHIELPVAEAPAAVAAEDLPSRPVPAGPVPVGDSGARRVLYIEDDAANAHLMTQLFAEEPRLDLMTTMYGKLGLELARQHRPDLILLDAHLPDLEGDEVLKRLRGDDATRDIPVIAVSADASGEQRARMTALGAARYLTKPLTLNVVLTAVWEVLEPPAVEHQVGASS